MTMYSQHYNMGKLRHYSSPDTSSSLYKSCPHSGLSDHSASGLRASRNPFSYSSCQSTDSRYFDQNTYPFHLSDRRPRTSSMSSSRSSNGSMSLPKRPLLYKTTLCEVWVKGRNCRFGERCWFAHGEWELRSSMQNKFRKPEIHNVPSRAQQEWMVLSQTYGNASGSFNNFTKNSMNRFTRDAVSAQLRAGVEARLGKASSGESLESWSKLGALLQNMPSKQEDSNNSIWSASDLSLSSSCSSEAGVNRGFSYLDNLKEDRIVSHEICDMFAASGFCALGDDCSLEHRMRDFASE
ncbi:unnamed protein product [Auanema sp. JU1783]|nr:unnamed protein product [Auanema sp. JU1783]